MYNMLLMYMIPTKATMITLTLDCPRVGLGTFLLGIFYGRDRKRGGSFLSRCGDPAS